MFRKTDSHKVGITFGYSESIIIIHQCKFILVNLLNLHTKQTYLVIQMSGRGKIYTQKFSFYLQY